MLALSLCLSAAIRVSLAQTGANGQSCGPVIDDNPADACTVTNGVFSSLSDSSEIECEENFDCCFCASITCGTANSPTCEKFNAGGDSAAFFVSNIEIYGDPDDGVTIECGGDSSCEGSELTVTNVKEFKCGGDRACTSAQWTLACLADEPCKVECDGDESCAGDRTTNTRSSFTISNSNGLKCSDRACSFSQFDLSSNVEGDLECDGESSCTDAIIAISNVEKVKCGTDLSCANAQITVTDPSEDFSVECGGEGACQGLTLTVVIPATSSVSELNGLDCSAVDACRDAVVTFTNNRAQPVTIEDLNCEAEGGCASASFTFNGDISFEECKCGDEGGCAGALGISDCDGAVGTGTPAPTAPTTLATPTPTTVITPAPTTPTTPTTTSSTTTTSTTTPSPTEADVCDDGCDAFSVTVDGTEIDGDEMCVTYRVTRQFDDGICEARVKWVTLGLCDSDSGLSAGDVNDLLSSAGGDSGDSSDDGDVKTKGRSINGFVGLKVFIGVNSEKTFRVCFDADLIADPIEFAESALIKRDKTKYECTDRSSIQGLPCLDSAAVLSAFGVEGQGEQADDAEWGALSELDEPVRWTMLFVFVALGVVMLVSCYVCLMRGRRIQREALKSQVDMHTADGDGSGGIELQEAEETETVFAE